MLLHKYIGLSMLAMPIRLSDTRYQVTRLHIDALTGKGNCIVTHMLMLVLHPIRTSPKHATYVRVQRASPLL